MGLNTDRVRNGFFETIGINESNSRKDFSKKGTRTYEYDDIDYTNVIGVLNDDYYKFMYTDVFGSAELVQIINDRDNGVID